VSFFVPCLLLAVGAALSGCASATDSVGDALKARHRRSLIDVDRIENLLALATANGWVARGGTA
jgi:type IV pilus biogenesis protein CpaD/CtpE